MALHLYRIAQEAVTNAIRHAKANDIHIRLEAKDQELTLQVLDDGIGIDDQRDRHQGLGLRIMEHRCELVGGTFSVRRRDAGGTALMCTVPNFPGA
jgi:signal transduction histidine kinase